MEDIHYQNGFGVPKIMRASTVSSREAVTLPSILLEKTAFS